MPVTGHCLCRAITYEYDAKPNWTVYCHCESCRRAASAPAVPWISIPRPAFRFTHGTPRSFASSPGVKRTFCGTCGSPLTHEADRIPDEVHVHALSLTDPSSLTPSMHVYAQEQLSWFEVADGLPRYAATERGGARPLHHGPRTKT